MNQSISLDQAKINFMSEKILENIQVFLDIFEIEYKHIQNYISFACPIHGGDNQNAFCMYLDGNTVKGNWCCYTHHCEKVFKPTAFGFVRGLLSNRENGWTGNINDKKYDFVKTYNYCRSVLNIDDSDLPKVNVIEKQKFCSDVNIYASKKIISKGWDLHAFLPKINIPSPYFLSRGYSKETLEYFHVGDLKKNEGIFKDRAVVPILSSDGINAVGFTGRSIHDKCEKCNQFHSSSCESKNKNYVYSKWVNNKGFAKERHLYNWHNALKFLGPNKTLIICEGPGDVWSLHEKGIQNAIAIFGTSLTDSQQILLETSDINNIILLLDNDEAGMKAKEKIKKSLGRFYNILIPSYEGNDPGSTTSNLESICNG